MSENSSARTCVTLAGERRDHQRKALGDAAGVDAGAVQRDAAGVTGHLERREVLPSPRKEPTERRDDVLARAQDALDDCRIGEDRAVEDAVRVEREQRVDVARRGDAERCDPGQLARIATVLGATVDPASDQLELGVIDDALDRGAADAAGGPLDDAILHGMILLAVRLPRRLL